jgi:hypothetical protein
MEDIDKAKQVVERFIYEMNLWEKCSEEIDNDEKDGLSWEQKDAVIKEKVADIITKYCTPKKRMMSAPNSIMRGLEGSYVYDPLMEKIDNVQIEKNKILVYTIKQEEKESFCYVLLMKNNQWLIDSKKRKFYGEEKWSNSYL